VTTCPVCGCIIIDGDGRCTCSQQAREPLPLSALCRCGACVELASNEVYAPGGTPLVWGPEYCASCGDAVGEPGSRAELEQENALLRHRLTLRRSCLRAMRKALLEERVLLGVAEAELVDAKALTAELEALQAGPQTETVIKLLALAHDLGAEDDRALCEEAASRLQALERERDAEREVSAARLAALSRPGAVEKDTPGLTGEPGGRQCRTD
jgi:hypothetical protein